MTESEKALYEYLVDYVTDDETAKIIIKGGEQGYYYGNGGYVEIDRNDKEMMDKIINDEDAYLIDDAGLDNAYLIGSMP